MTFEQAQKQEELFREQQELEWNAQSQADEQRSLSPLVIRSNARPLSSPPQANDNLSGPENRDAHLWSDSSTHFNSRAIDSQANRVTSSGAGNNTDSNRRPFGTLNRNASDFDKQRSKPRLNGRSSQGDYSHANNDNRVSTNNHSSFGQRSYAQRSNDTSANNVVSSFNGKLHKYYTI